jgi:hypothetical protein
MESWNGELDWHGGSKYGTKNCVNSQTLPVHDFCHRQHLKFIGHVCRLDSDAIQKQVLSDFRTARKTWNSVERLLDVDIQQKNYDGQNSLQATDHVGC